MRGSGGASEAGAEPRAAAGGGGRGGGGGGGNGNGRGPAGGSVWNAIMAGTAEASGDRSRLTGLAVPTMP
ncbi:hypothetical protein GRJ2_001917300 [Grus japonensis]|uniref:Uncharacterized protein n=1 Tax=Grus japonensis TaxID=30415 RepID=A0ABC9XBM0_GRUJA